MRIFYFTDAKDSVDKWSAFKLISTNDTTELFQVSLCKTFRSASESMKCVQQRLPHFMSLISIAQRESWNHSVMSFVNKGYDADLLAFLILAISLPLPGGFGTCIHSQRVHCAVGMFSHRALSLATSYIFARVRIIGTLVPFCVIGNSKEFPITQKKPWLHAQESPVTVTTAFGSSVPAAIPAGMLCHLVPSVYPIFPYSSSPKEYPPTEWISTSLLFSTKIR